MFAKRRRGDIIAQIHLPEPIRVRVGPPMRCVWIRTLSWEESTIVANHLQLVHSRHGARSTNTNEKKQLFRNWLHYKIYTTRKQRHLRQKPFKKCLFTIFFKCSIYTYAFTCASLINVSYSEITLVCSSLHFCL